MATSVRSEINKKCLEFGFEVVNIQFNHTGRHFLRVTLETSFTRDPQGVCIRCGEGDWSRDHKGETDVIDQHERQVFYTFQDPAFTFFLPKGALLHNKD